jgi:hypothetical protein
MLRNVNDNKLGSRVIRSPTDRENILQKTHFEAKPQKRQFFTEKKTQMPDFNSNLEILRTIYTPNEDNKIYYPYLKSCEELKETYHEYDCTSFMNYSK